MDTPISVLLFQPPFCSDTMNGRQSNKDCLRSLGNEREEWKQNNSRKENNYQLIISHISCNF